MFNSKTSGRIKEEGSDRLANTHGNARETRPVGGGNTTSALSLSLSPTPRPGDKARPKMGNDTAFCLLQEVSGAWARTGADGGDTYTVARK